MKTSSSPSNQKTKEFNLFKEKNSWIKDKSKPIQGLCGKMMYFSPNHVERMINLKTKKDKVKGNGSTLRGYFCDTCCAWHMTSRRAWV